jgi:hypothetical protein
VGGLKIEPASGSSWTEFEVHDTHGAVRIIARKGDLKLIDASGTAIAQGQETTRDQTSEKGKKKRDRAAGAVPAAGGGILDSPYAIGIGAVGRLTAWVLIRNDEPVSPK